MASAIKIAAVLLVASLCGEFVDANLLSGLFSSHEGKSYVILANHIYKATRSTKLADNTKAAESLLSAHADADEHLVKLVNMFKSLKDDQSDPESMCSRDNLANMLHVAEAMRAGGNLGAKKVTEPILRLNRIIVEFIMHGQAACIAHLDSKWPNPWKPSFTDGRMKFYMEHLSLPINYLYEEYMGKQHDPTFQRNYWGSGLSSSLADIALKDSWDGKRVDPDCKDLIGTTNKTILALQLHEYVYKPCREFVTLEEAHNVLEPYNDLFKSYYLIISDMKEYLSNKEVPRVPWVRNYDNYKKYVRALARAYRACQRFVTMPEEDVLHQLRKSRKLDQRLKRH